MTKVTGSWGKTRRAPTGESGGGDSGGGGRAGHAGEFSGRGAGRKVNSAVDAPTLHLRCAKWDRAIASDEILSRQIDGSPAALA